MKVFISVDMEGVSGLVRWMDVASQGIDFAVNRKLMTLDTNAAIAGAFAAGATEVVVEENHGVEDLCVLLMEEIDPRCRVIRGAGRPGASTMSGLDAETGVILLVGHHARAGSFPGVMAHTISYGWFKTVRLNGELIGESDFFALRGQELGVPIGLVTGDQVVAEQVLARCPNSETVVVKQSLGHQSADVIPPARARPMIEAGALRAVSRAMAGELTLSEPESSPYQFEVVLKKPIPDSMLANLEMLDEYTIDGQTIVTSAPDMALGFRRVAYLGYAEAPGVTRY